MPSAPGNEHLHDPFSIILATSNGTGMGHLSRQVAVGSAIANRANPVIFSLSAAASVIPAHGLRGEYCPSYDRLWMPYRSWHGYLADRIRALLDETRSRALVFDGVVPYRGLLQARIAVPDVPFVWIRRGLWREDANRAALRSRSFFDLILEPGDLAASADRGPTVGLGDARRVPPISIQEAVSPLPREEAAAALGLDPTRPAALVTLGTSQGDEDPSSGTAAIQALLEHDEWQVAVTHSHIACGQALQIDSRRVIELRGFYPLARYLKAFDGAVSAAGYNTFHELLFAGVPTLFVPRLSTGTDDQVTRAQWAARAGLALVADEADVSSIEANITRLLDGSMRKALSAACAELASPTGAAVAADVLTALVRDFTGHRTGAAERRRAAELAVRAAITTRLGPRAAGVARGAMGRPRPPGPAGRLRVRLVQGQWVDEPGSRAMRPDAITEITPLILTDRLDGDLIRADSPVEHFLESASTSYYQRRLEIIRRYYDVRA